VPQKTDRLPTLRRRRVRVKRCGKSAPRRRIPNRGDGAMPSPRQALEVTRPARQTPPEARPNRKRGGRGVRFAATVWLAPLSAALADRSSGRPLEPGGDLRPRGMITLPDLAHRRLSVAFEAGRQNPAYRSPRKILVVECESEAFARVRIVEAALLHSTDLARVLGRRAAMGRQGGKGPLDGDCRVRTEEYDLWK